MHNKKLGNHFEAELCETLADEGFWCHNLAQNSDGQPADVIAVKDGQAYLIDCKVCSRGRFQFDRIEDNQRYSMELWRECGNGEGLFALSFSGQIYMVGIESMWNCRNRHASMTEELAAAYGCPLGEWLWVRR
jgi:Holliday junction resolvase